MDPNPHFLALLTYLTSDEGGRTIPALSGYGPAIKFPFDTGLYTGAQKFIDTELAFPGDVLNAEITMLNREYFKGKLYEGLDFDFFEGQKRIGHGIIKKMFEPELT